MFHCKTILINLNISTEGQKPRLKKIQFSGENTFLNKSKIYYRFAPGEGLSIHANPLCGNQIVEILTGTTSTRTTVGTEVLDAVRPTRLN